MLRDGYHEDHDIQRDLKNFANCTYSEKSFLIFFGEILKRPLNFQTIKGPFLKLIKHASKMMCSTLRPKLANMV